MSKLEDWDKVDAKEFSLEAMDALVARMALEWTQVELAKAQAAEVRATYDATEKEILEILKAAKKSKYQVDGLGTVYISNRYVTRVPKDISAKKALFDFIKDTKGGETLMGMVSINHQTLNSFLNQEYEAHPGTTVPGVEAPTHEESLGFRTEKKK